MGIHSLARGTNQPFYHILTEDGSSRYVAEGNWSGKPLIADIPAANLFYMNVQDSLELFPADLHQPVLNHVDIGLYFDRFDGQRYVPNLETMAIYPDDEAVALSLLGKST